jgi:hypothetical protein
MKHGREVFNSESAMERIENSTFDALQPILITRE